MSRLFSSQSFFSPRGCLVRILILVFRILGEYCNCVYMNCWLCDPCRTATWWMMLSLSRNVPCPFRWQGWNCIVLPTTTKKRAIHDKRYGKMKISPDIFQPQFMVVFDLWMSDFSSSWNVNDVGTGIISDSSWLVFPKNYLCILFKTQILPKLAVELSNVNHKWDMCPTWNLYVKLLYLIHIIRTYILLLG